MINQPILPHSHICSCPNHASFISLTNQNWTFLKTQRPLTNERAGFASFTQIIMQICSTLLHTKRTERLPHILLKCNLICGVQILRDKSWSLIVFLTPFWRTRRGMDGRVRQKGLKCWNVSQTTNKVSNVEWSWGLIVFLTFMQIWHFTRNWDLNGILTVTRFDILMSFWGPFQHLTPFAFNIWVLIRYLRPFSAFDTWDLIGYLRPFSAFDTLSADIWDLIHYLRPFSTFETLFIQHLRPYSLFEALFSNWDPFHSTFETLLSIWHPFQHLTPFWRTRPPIHFATHPDLWTSAIYLFINLTVQCYSFNTKISFIEEMR